MKYIRIFNRFLSLTPGFLSLLLLSCSSNGQVSNQGVIQRKTQFYGDDGTPYFTHYLKMWYKDSLYIQEITGVTSVTDTKNVTTVTYPLIKCRYIDLRTKVLCDYKTFSDTSRMFCADRLPDSLLRDAGWAFYSEKAFKMKGTPEPLGDTTIEGVTYARKKFYFSWDDPTKRYLIGYFRCDGKENLFTLEKDHSRSINCAMVKFFDYMVGKERPIASVELFYLSESLTKEELKVFDAWEMNEKKILLPK